VRRRYKTNKQIRKWLREHWIPSFDLNVFYGPRGPSSLVRSLATVHASELYYYGYHVQSYRRMAKPRRLALCRKVLQEMAERTLHR